MSGGGNIFSNTYMSWVLFYALFSFTQEGVNLKADVLKAMDGYFLNTPDDQGSACLWRICLRYYRVVLERVKIWNFFPKIQEAISY